MPTATRGNRTSAGKPADRMRWIASAALFVPLLLLLFVALRTWGAERRYATVTQKVVHDYAGIAAWQYSRKANIALHDEAMRAFTGIARGHQRSGTADSLQSPGAIVAVRGARVSPVLESARFAFTHDVVTGRMEYAGGTPDHATRTMLERRLLEITRTARSDDEPHRVVFDSAGASAYVIFLWTIAAPDRPVRAVYGVASDPSALENTFIRVIGEADLLPAARLGRPVTTSDVAVRLTRKDGAVVFASGDVPGATAATDTATLRPSNLKATVDLSPEIASALLVGGAPASQLPSLALMIVIASVLAAIGLVHERRTRELTRLRARFVANVSHELRTPLAQISMFAETLTLGRERSPGEARHFASIIFAEARRLTGLVESVLRFSRLELHDETLRLEIVSVGREVAEAVETFEPVAQVSEVTLAMELDPDAYARLDRAAFRQILLNLLDNAVKHAGRGKTVWLSVATGDAGITILVDDAGPGVPEEWRERVFAPFVRAEERKVAGAGIGLAVVRDLVTAHGGRVWIEQSPKGGARFIVTLPGAAAPARKDVAEPVEAPA